MSIFRYRVIVFGSRYWTNVAPIYQALAVLKAEHGEDLLVVHGDCPTGADAIAEEVCRLHLGTPVEQEKHPADWKRYGTSAGPRRNAEMATLGARLVLGFRDHGPSPGSDGMRRECVRRGLTGLWYMANPRDNGIMIKPLDFDDGGPEA